MLFPNLQSAPLSPPVTAIVIKFYLNIRFPQYAISRQVKNNILDALTPLQPLLLIVSLDGQDMACITAGIEVIGPELHRQAVMVHHRACVGVHEVAVCLEVDPAAGLQDAAVTLHKISGCKTLGGLFHLRIGKREPNLAHLTRRKKTVNKFDVGA